MTRRLRTDPTAIRFGAIIHRLRTSRGWTLVDFARASAMNRRYLASLENGTNVPTLIVVLHLAKVLGVRARAIIEELEGTPAS